MMTEHVVQMTAKTGAASRVIWLATACALGAQACQQSPDPSRAPARAGAQAPGAPAALVDGRWDERQLAQIAKLTLKPPPPTDETNAVAQDPRAAALGQRLFFDARLSKDGQVSCASCHKPEHGFSMNEPLGKGLHATARHVPSLLNVGYQRWYDWDGKADTLWGQAIRPLESPQEQGTTRVRLAQLIASDERLRAEHEAIFGPLPQGLLDASRFPPQARPDPAHPDQAHHVAWMTMRPEDRDAVNRVTAQALKALAAYQLRLVSWDSAFDRYARGIIRGQAQASALISDQAKEGLALFLGQGRCVVCHSGALMSDMTFHNLGLTSPGWLKPLDEGRWDGVLIAKRNEFGAAGPHSDAPDGDKARWVAQLVRTPEDHGQFKTPSLRDVARTPPYMHGGHLMTLEAVVSFYNHLPGQAELGHREDALRPLGLSDAQELAIVAFLKTLDGAPLEPALLRSPDAPPPSPDASSKKSAEAEEKD